MGNLLTRVGIFALQWALNSNIQAVKDRANRLALNQFAYSVQPRPRPISMAAEYATWEGLTNRTYSGRQLAPDEDFNTDLPPLQDVLELFRRTEEKLDDRTTLLLPFFAQWFVDG